MRKMLAFLSGCLVLFITFVPVHADTDSQIIEAIQQRYDSTQSFQAEFTQKSLLKIMGQTQEARGTVVIKKPGQMKWDYSAPDRQLLISNRDALWLYLPEENQVTKMKVESIYSSNTPALFLAGRGRLTESFRVEKTGKTSSGLEVLLIPRHPEHNVDRLVLIVDPESYQITGSRIHDKLGNQTEMLFRNIEINPDIEDRTFDFKVPAGVELIDFSSSTTPQ